MKTIDTALFDKQFDDDELDIIEHLDLSRAKRIKSDTRRVNVDFPVWMLESLDREAQHLGVARQALIKLWIAQHLPPYTQ